MGTLPRPAASVSWPSWAASVGTSTSSVLQEDSLLLTRVFCFTSTPLRGRQKFFLVKLETTQIGSNPRKFFGSGKENPLDPDSLS